MRTLSTALAALAMLVGAAALAAGQVPADGAQTRTQLAAQVPAPLDPGASTTVTVEVTYSYQTGSEAVSDGPTRIFLSVRDAPAWLDARFGKWTLEAPVEAGGGQTTLTAPLNIAVEDDAPTGEQGNVGLVGVASENEGMATSEGSTTLPIQVASDGSGSSSSASTAGADASQASLAPNPGPAAAAALVAGLAGLTLGVHAGRRG